MVEVPANTPVTTPVAGLMVELPLLLLQMPPIVALLSTVVAPIHTLVTPVITAGDVFTVRTAVLLQPDANV